MVTEQETSPGEPVTRVGMAISVKPEKLAYYQELHADGNTGVRDLLAGPCRFSAPRYPAGAVVCECGAEALYQRQRTGACKTLLGTIQLTRAYYLCSQCHHGYYPLDQQLGLCAGSISRGLPRLDELLALLGCQFSFAHSAELVARLSLVEVSAGCCRKSTEALGQRVAEAEEEQRQARVGAALGLSGTRLWEAA